MNRQTLVLIALSTLLLCCVVVFSIFFLIPKGKEYRMLRLDNKKEMQYFHEAQQRFDSINEKLLKLEKDHAHTIKAFKTPFDSEHFIKKYKKNFETLSVSEVTTFTKDGSFVVYEVNATSKITSPESFYHFVEEMNKSEWIIGINFPIHFEREGEYIRSSFMMKVHQVSLEDGKESENISSKEKPEKIEVHSSEHH